MNSTRREFLIRGGTLASMFPVAWALKPYVLKESGDRATGKPLEDKILVVLQLAGGNDGINTLIPYADADYYKHRRIVAVKKDSVLKLNDDCGLHPSMGAMKKLYDAGHLAVIQGVGYPSPNRSHFRSTDIWESGIPEREETKTGWLGRAIDARTFPAESVPAVCAGEIHLPLTLVGRRSGAVSIFSLESFRLQGRGEGFGMQRQALEKLALGSDPENTDLSFLRSSYQVAYRCSEKLEKLDAATSFKSEIQRKLQVVAQLIEAGIGTRIFHVSLGGFDTHADQGPAHALLLQQLSEAVASFFDQLKGRGQEKRVLLMTFSEFGRRLEENGSRGTDHGAAAPMFLVSGALRRGVYGPRPSLSELEDGDIKSSVDFRSVYAAVLEDFLGWNATPSLGKQFPKLADLFTA